MGQCERFWLCSHGQLVSATSFRGRSRISGKGVHMYKGVGVHFAYYPLTMPEGYSFGVVRASVHTFCLSVTISQYLLVTFDSFLVQMINIMESRYPISLVKISPLTLELLPMFWYRQL